MTRPGPGVPSIRHTGTYAGVVADHNTRERRATCVRCGVNKSRGTRQLCSACRVITRRMGELHLWEDE